ncbi:MAG: hypothetical protein BWY47_00700 [Bacteroidetes bacterium ADurb.Bin302]|nr:MAG: hypothetical protein BWY47_00700 [Bacteroidetes bacterium ADurb.Bin302]
MPSSAACVTPISPPGKLAINTPKAIGTNSRGSYCFFIPRYNRIKAKAYMIRNLGSAIILLIAVISYILFNISSMVLCFYFHQYIIFRYHCTYWQTNFCDNSVKFSCNSIERFHCFDVAYCLTFLYKITNFYCGV